MLRRHHGSRAPRTFVACATIAALLVAGCGGDDGEPSEAPRGGPTVKLGSVFSVSGAGIAFGPQQLRAARLAAQRVNREGGVDGARLEIVQRDDGSDPERTPEVMRELIEEERVLALLGPTFSNAAATGDPLANRLGVPVLAVSNTGPGVVGECPYPCELVFRNSLGEAEAIPANVRSLIGGGTAVAGAIVAYPREDPFARSTAEIAVDAFVANDATTAEVEFDDPSRLEELPGVPEALMIVASSGEVAAEAIEAARDGGYEGPILGGNAFNSSLAAERAGAAGEGARSAAAWYLGNDEEANREFVEAYRDAHGEEPDQFAAQAYTGVLLLAEAAAAADLSLANPRADRAALAEALAEVEIETPLGPFRFTAEHDVSQPVWIVEMDGEGGYELVERVDPEAP
jgi:branched-chain amino acid transport system substrate-binding protein